MSIKTFCLECDHELDLGNQPQVGRRVKCDYCETQLEIINTEPLELDWIYERGSYPLGASDTLDSWSM
jgi:hypothetical protein